jgi:hypothetical protein
MNHDEQFEDRLRQQQTREIPSAWRQEILDAAKSASAPMPARRHASTTLREKLLSLLWPHPKAWAALASVWLIALTLHFTTRDTSENALAYHTPPPPRQMRELWREKERMFAELVGPNPTSDADRPKPNAPHSRRREAFINV